MGFAQREHHGSDSRHHERSSQPAHVPAGSTDLPSCFSERRTLCAYRLAATFLVVRRALGLGGGASRVIPRTPARNLPVWLPSTLATISGVPSAMTRPPPPPPSGPRSMIQSAV